MTRPTILLLGVGDYDKRSDFKPLFREFGDTVKGVVASGITVPEILEAAEATGFKNIKVCRGTFDEMVEEAGLRCVCGIVNGVALLLAFLSRAKKLAQQYPTEFARSCLVADYTF